MYGSTVLTMMMMMIIRVALPKVNVGHGLGLWHLINVVIDVKVAGVAVFIHQGNDGTGRTGHVLHRSMVVPNHGQG